MGDFLNVRNRNDEDTKVHKRDQESLVFLIAFVNLCVSSLDFADGARGRPQT